MEVGIKLAMLGWSGDPKSYYVSDIPGTSSFPKYELVSSLSFLSSMMSANHKNCSTLRVHFPFPCYALYLQLA